jgi:hypothetical protein
MAASRALLPPLLVLTALFAGPAVVAQLSPPATPTPTPTSTFSSQTATPSATPTAPPSTAPAPATSAPFSNGIHCAADTQCESGHCNPAGGICCDLEQCPSGQGCDIYGHEGSCSPPNDPGQPCFVTADCAAGLTCVVTGMVGVCSPPAQCVGDCGGVRHVAIDDIMVLVNIVLGRASDAACPHGMPDGTATDVATILQAVDNALNGCGLSA